MANPFYVSPPNVLGALMLGEKTYSEAQKVQGRRQALERMSAGDVKGALAQVMGAGDFEMANAISKFTDTQATQDYRNRSLSQTGDYQQAQIANMERSRDLQEQALRQGKTTRGIQVDPLTGETSAYELGPDGLKKFPSAPAATATPMNLSSQEVTGVERGPVEGNPALFNDRYAAAQQSTQAPTQAPQDKVAAVMQKYGGKPGDGKNWAAIANLPPAVQERIVRTSRYDLDPKSYPGRIVPNSGGQSAQGALSDATATFDPTYNQMEYPIIRQNRVRFDTGPQGNTVRSLDVIVDHAGTLRDLGAALKNGDIQLFNRISQRWAQETGKPAPTNFDMAKGIVGTELVKALGVAGAGTEAERAELGQRISRASSPDQIVGTIDSVVRPLLGGQLRGLRQQFVSSTRRSEEEFNKKLQPGTLKFLDTKGDTTSASPQARVVIQNGNRFQLNPDGTHQFLGPAQ